MSPAVGDGLMKKCGSFVAEKISGCVTMCRYRLVVPDFIAPMMNACSALVIVAGSTRAEAVCDWAGKDISVWCVRFSIRV